MKWFYSWFASLLNAFGATTLLVYRDYKLGALFIVASFVWFFMTRRER